MELKRPSQLALTEYRMISCPEGNNDMDFSPLNKATKATEEGSLEKGFVHVYTGEGKGKTTAAFGIALGLPVPAIGSL